MHDIETTIATEVPDIKAQQLALRATAERVAHWLATTPGPESSSPPAQLVALLTGENSDSMLATLPGGSEDEVVASSLRILTFVQAVAALAEQLQHLSTDDSPNETIDSQHALSNIALELLMEYGLYMVQGRTASSIRGALAKDVATMRTASHVVSAEMSLTETPVEVARALLHSTVAVLRVLQRGGVLEEHERCLSRLRVMLRPSLFNAAVMSVGELCDIGFGLSCTCDATLHTRSNTTTLSTSGASYEDHGDWVALGGELVKRLRRQTTPDAMALKEFSKSSRFSFSLKERKERERSEQNAKSIEQGNAPDLFTIAELASLSTSLGMSQFRDATFSSQPPAEASATGVASGQLWECIAQATCKLVEAEVKCAEVDAVSGELDVSFTRQELRSICFACDYAGQSAAYDMVMRTLVSCGVVGEYIPSPSAARSAAFDAAGRAIDA